MDREKIRSLLLTAVQAAVKAGQIVLEVYETDFDVEHKDDKSPLTLADSRSHETITAFLDKTRIPILSEEGHNIAYEERKQWEQLWIIDPLDGTKEFIKRNGEFTINIALVERHRPVLGVIYVPVKNTIYFGAEGYGSYKFDNSVLQIPATIESLLSVSQKIPLARSTDHPIDQSRPYTVIGSRSHATSELQAFVEEKRREFGDVNFISAGSSLKICLVAEGKADIYPRLGPTMEWDTAAGQAIAENADRSVLVWNTQEPLLYNREALLNPWFVVS